MTNGPTSLSPEHLSRREESSYGKYFYHRCRHIWSGETSVLSKSRPCRRPSAVCQLLLLTARPKAGFSYLPTMGSWGGPLGNACPGASYTGQGLCFTSQSARGGGDESGAHVQAHPYFDGVQKVGPNWLWGSSVYAQSEQLEDPERGSEIPTLPPLALHGCAIERPPCTFSLSLCGHIRVWVFLGSWPCKGLHNWEMV